MAKKVCVVGAGISGLVSIKACLENELDVVCFEKTEDIGGLWRFRDDSILGVGSVSKSTISITSKEMSAFSDFPPDNNIPNYLRHDAVLKYVEDYSYNYNLRPYINFGREVVRIQPSWDNEETGRWEVMINNVKEGSTEALTFDAIMVGCGSYTTPNIPSYPGLEVFKGVIMHSLQYKDYRQLEHKRVVVVGIGSSGTNIATELGRFGTKPPVYLSSRKGGWVVPRLSQSGMPWDILHSRRYLNLIYKEFLPRSISAAYYENQVNKLFDHDLYNMRPVYRITDRIPTVEDELAFRIITGLVQLKGAIDHFTNNGVVFKGECDEHPVDAVVMATGFDRRIPFLDETIVRFPKKRSELYFYVFPTTIMKHTLAIIGQVQPTGALAPVAEMQARWAAHVFAGHCKLPGLIAMKNAIDVFNNRRKLNPYEAESQSYMDTLATFIGVKPKLSTMVFKDPRLFWSCFFGPLVPYQYRLSGPFAWNFARKSILAVNERVTDPFKTRVPNIRLFRLPFVKFTAAIVVGSAVLMGLDAIFGEKEEWRQSQLGIPHKN